MRAERHGLRIVAAVAALSLVLVGCGNGSEQLPDEGAIVVQDLARAAAPDAGDGSSGGLVDLRQGDLRDLATPVDLHVVDLRVVDLGPCGGRCGGATPLCDLLADRCVACLADGDCRGGDGGASMACCDHACVDTALSKDHCGGCGKACGGGPDATCCAGACLRTDSDPLACGGCGVVCRFANAMPLCQAATCRLGACLAGFADCDADARSGCETAIASDVANCGACGKACAVPHAMAACVGGACSIAACDAGYRNCNGQGNDGCEVNAGVDAKNCGACGNDCAQLPHVLASSCQASACVVMQCAPGFGNCNKKDGDGCELPVDADAKNCGACGMVCPAPANTVATCKASACGVGGCLAGFGDCDGNGGNGCEAEFNRDPAHCGGCGKACPQGQVCAGGRCSSLFGTGRDGNLVVNANTTLAGFAETHLFAAAMAKAQSVQVVSAAGIAAGDKILVVNVRSAIGNEGVWEVADVAATNGTTLSLGSALAGSYPEPQNTIVRTLPQYADVTVAVGATLSGKAWDGASLTGGIVAFVASGTVTVDGKLAASGLGYAGGVGNSSDPQGFIWKTQGESYLGVGATDLPNNVANGGGGCGGSKRLGCAGAGGGGGGYGTAGGRGGDNNYNCGAIQVGGVGGGTYGDAMLGRIFLGSGGGSGGYTVDPLAGAGGPGGGIIVVFAPKIVVNGSIEARGGDGATEYKIYGAGGGGSGGSVYLRTQQALNDPSRVTAPGGNGGGVTMGGMQVGGNGGAGRVVLDVR